MYRKQPKLAYRMRKGRENTEMLETVRLSVKLKTIEFAAVHYQTKPLTVPTTLLR